MANLKNITDLPMAESAEGLNLIVNDNGSAKQIAASAVGAQADWAVTDENSPAFIKNKPVEEWDLDITVNLAEDTESGELTRVANLNAGSFVAAKNKVLNNEQVKVKVHNIFPSPEDASVVAHENSVIYCITYSPGDSITPFDAIILLGHSFIEDMMLMYIITPENTIKIMQY